MVVGSPATTLPALLCSLDTNHREKHRFSANDLQLQFEWMCSISSLSVHEHSHSIKCYWCKIVTLIHGSPDQFCLPPHYGQPHGRCRGTAGPLFPQLPGQLRPWHSGHKHGNPAESLHLRYLHPRSFWVQLINLIQVGKQWNGQSFLFNGFSVVYILKC